MNARPLLTAALLLATAVPAAHAATVLTYVEKTPGSQAPTVERRMVLAGTRLRLETSAAEGGRVLLYDAGSGVLYVVDEAKRSYTELRRSEVPFNEEEVKTGPVKTGPVKKPRKGKDQEPAPPVATAPDGTAYRKVDSGFIVNGFRTDKYEGTRNGQKVEELYVADAKALGVGDGELQALHAMADTFGTGRQARLSLGAKLPGVPVRITRFEGGKPVQQIDLSTVSQEDVPVARLELPAGFTRLAQGLASGN